jgi:probable rRNA maturation factor
LRLRRRVSQAQHCTQRPRYSGSDNLFFHVVTTPTAKNARKRMNRQAYPELSLSLQWANPKHKSLLARHAVAKAIRHTLKQGLIEGSQIQNGVHACEITIRVVDTQEAQALNHQYRKKVAATNVLTFDYSKLPVLCADIVLCAPVLEAEALAQGKELRAHYMHMLVHGTLHAMGYDHERSVSEAKRMEGLEVLILQGLGQINPYEA